MGDIVISENTESILETFVGSCIALCVYDPFTKIGGLAHIMLPEKSNGKGSSDNSPGKYADQAIYNLLNKLTRKGAKIVRLRAKIAGGANMFSYEGGNSFLSIGERNAQAVKTFLKDKGIPILSEDVGMNYGRSVKFNVATGQITISNKNGSEKIL